jgi:hypothetical protein
MPSRIRFLIVACALALAAPGVSAARVAEQAPAPVKEAWRYTFHNGEWWYWLPAGRWVYWRDDRWNDYTPRTYTPPRSSRAVAIDRAGSSRGNPTAGDPDIFPFYGRTTADLDRRPLETNGEVGPFYGNTLPSEILGAQRASRGIRPFYGRADSSDD